MEKDKIVLILNITHEHKLQMRQTFKCKKVKYTNTRRKYE